MYEISKTLSFCYGHRLLDYSGPCQHLHGHNGKVEIHLQNNTLDKRGMIVDFSDIKKNINAWIKQTLDHTLLLRHDDPLIPALDQHGERYLAMNDNPTAENIAKFIFDYAERQSWPIASVTFWETDTSFARYRK